MSIYLDTKYLNLVSSCLRNFTQHNKELWNCACPICGDSKKDTTKARGYFFPHNNILVFKCHNCGVSTSFRNILKQVNPVLYKQYVFESLKESNLLTHEERKEKDEVLLDEFKAKHTMVTAEGLQDHVLDPLVRVDKLPDGHICKEYVKSRMIPEKFYSILYYVEDFKKYCNTVKPNTFKSDFPKEERLIIPVFNVHGKVIGFQGRLLDNSNNLLHQQKNNREYKGIRYFTVKLNDSKEDLIYGLERVDYKKPIFCCEGQIDSLFLPNCIAVLGACYKNQVIKSLQSNLTIVPDNEKRNNEVCNQIENMIQMGYKVCLWNNAVEEKDINEMIKAGHTPEELTEIIHNNTVSGFSGLIKFKTWRQV